MRGSLLLSLFNSVIQRVNKFEEAIGRFVRALYTEWVIDVHDFNSEYAGSVRVESVEGLSRVVNNNKLQLEDLAESGGNILNNNPFIHRFRLGERVEVAHTGKDKLIGLSCCVRDCL